jgi:hypothetical protein
MTVSPFLRAVVLFRLSRRILPNCSVHTADAIAAGLHSDEAMLNRPELARFLATQGPLSSGRGTTASSPARIASATLY